MITLQPFWKHSLRVLSVILFFFVFMMGLRYVQHWFEEHDLQLAKNYVRVWKVPSGQSFKTILSKHWLVSEDQVTCQYQLPSHYDKKVQISCSSDFNQKNHVQFIFDLIQKTIEPVNEQAKTMWKTFDESLSLVQDEKGNKI